MGSFLYVLIFLIQSDPRTRLSAHIPTNLFLLSLAVGSCVLFAFPVSGGCLNPAAGVGLSFTNLLDKGTSKEIEYIWVYGLLPFLGGLLAVAFYELVFKRMQLENSEEAIEAKKRAKMSKEAEQQEAID